MFRKIIVINCLLIIEIFSDPSVKTTSKCDNYFNNLSIAIGSTFQCFSEHSQPAALCGQCFNSMLHIENILNDNTTSNLFDQPCSIFINLSSIYSPWQFILPQVLNTWKLSECQSCLGNGSLSNQYIADYPNLFSKMNFNFTPYDLTYYNNKTLRYFDQLLKTVRCISSFLPINYPSMLDPINFTPVIELETNSSVCFTCGTEYRILNSIYDDFFYDKMEKQDQFKQFVLDMNSIIFKPTKNPTCSDVADSINRTQWIWFHMLNCTAETGPIRSIVALVPVFVCGILTIIFYSCLFFVFRKQRYMIIYKQARVEAAIETDPNQLLKHKASITSQSDVDTTENLPNMSIQFRQREFGSQCQNLCGGIFSNFYNDTNDC